MKHTRRVRLPLERNRILWKRLPLGTLRRIILSCNIGAVILSILTLGVSVLLQGTQVTFSPRNLIVLRE